MEGVTLYFNDCKLTLVTNDAPKTGEQVLQANGIKDFVARRITASLPKDAGRTALALNGAYGASVDEKRDIEDGRWTTEEYSKLALDSPTWNEIMTVRVLCERAHALDGPEREAR